MKKINFHEFYFCDLDQQWWWFAILTVLIVYVIFRFIAISIDGYVAPAITRLSSAMGLSSGLSAVTLIALANGAGDVITAIVSSDGEGGVSYNIGALFGAGLFCTSLVIAVTVIRSPTQIVVTNNVLYRDVVFFILATVFVLIAAAIGEITTLIAVLMLVMYLALVITVVIQDKFFPEAKKDDTLIAVSEVKLDLESEPEKRKVSNALTNKLQKVARKINTMKRLATHAEKKKLVHELAEEKAQTHGGHEEVPTVSKVLDTLDLPLDLIRKLTILPAEEEHFHHYWTYLWCLFGVAFLVLFTVGFNLTGVYVILGAGLFFLGLFFLFQHRLSDKRALPKCFIFMNILSIVSGCLWAFVVIEVLVDLMTTVGLIAKLSNTFLGLTVLAIGNALPDALTTIALAKNGQAITGIIGTYAGQLFGLLIGFGIAQVKTTVTSGPQVFDLFQNPGDNLLDIIVVFMSLLTLTVTLIYGILNKKVFDKRFGYILVGLYGVFMLMAIGVQASEFF